MEAALAEAKKMTEELELDRPLLEAELAQLRVLTGVT